MWLIVFAFALVILVWILWLPIFSLGYPITVTDLPPRVATETDLLPLFEEMDGSYTLTLSRSSLDEERDFLSVETENEDAQVVVSTADATTQERIHEYLDSIQATESIQVEDGPLGVTVRCEKVADTITALVVDVLRIYPIENVAVSKIEEG